MSRSKKHVLKRQQHITLRIVSYLLAMTAGLVLAVFIFYSSKSRQPGFIAAIIGTWVLFALFCLYKISCAKKYKGVFRKGMLKVGELDEMDGIAFEKLACDILMANGFEMAENTPASGDFGVDILALKDGMTYAIQCKRYLEPVGLEAVQQVYAGRAYYECHVAAVLTNQVFTAGAKALADKIGVVLWDRDTLRELL